MKTEIIFVIAIALCTFSIANAVAQLNETEQIIQNPGEVATGQESVPVITANGTEVAEVAPAAAIESLSNSIFTVGIPAITGLIIAVVGLLRILPLSKRASQALDTVENGVKYVDTMAPKIKDDYITSGALKAGIELVASKLTPEDQAEFKKLMAPVAGIDAKVRETSAQIDDFRGRLPSRMKADNDEDIPRLKDGTVSHT